MDVLSCFFPTPELIFQACRILLFRRLFSFSLEVAPRINSRPWEKVRRAYCVRVFVHRTRHRRRCVFRCLYKCVSLSCYAWSRVGNCACVSLQVFSNCSCVGVAGNFTAGAGPCPHTDDCDRMFPYFLALSVITSFIISLGGTPGYMILIRSDYY